MNNDTFFFTAQETQTRRKNAGIDGLIHGIDHVAYRVRTGDREKALAEYISLTEFDYVETHFMPAQNAYTSVLNFKSERPAIVISEGADENSIVSQYVARYGARIHHVAFLVSDIHKVIALQKAAGVEFTSDDVIGDKDQGLLQIFTHPSPYTGDIIEYVQRFHGFKGFFLQDSVAALMQSTASFNK